MGWYPENPENLAHPDSDKGWWGTNLQKGQGRGDSVGKEVSID